MSNDHDRRLLVERSHPQHSVQGDAHLQSQVYHAHNSPLVTLHT